MSTFGRITNALVSEVNENNISLATLNFDFSLLKFDAPKEFQPLGSALSGRRRREAEEGLHYRTARRLGVLFEDLIPSTPKLIEAFGKRVFLLTSHFCFPDKFTKSMFSLDLAASVYKNLPGALDWRQPLCLYDLHPAFATIARIPIFRSPQPKALTLQEAFACVAKFESGTINLEPEDLSTALALCSEDSIFVAAVVLSDPFDTPAPNDIRRIAGNIGQPGLSILVAPQEPQIRKPSFAFNAVAHEPYGFLRENNFSGTSLHLPFTEWRFPLEASTERAIDQDVMVVESVISVLDRGKWVADLDIMGIDFEGVSRIVNICNNKDEHAGISHDPNYDYFSVDNWDELVDAPEGVGIFRAHSNWAARLAAVSIMSQKGQGHSIGVFGSNRVCFKCLEEETGFAEPHLLDHESPLPSFCID
ncbi:hypothetical protein P168DRAFT_285633 [Aspergillus campestris IBT 28561]|uniref:Uncharacterized protein n=1 Tax=Aspergillus campestris (strain IBT 28561) TaxID=1392248 RepID=A0A2I1CR78_ASPC2|nr:uncharacterized protein P168DRAFT_285633 [Aspergillus campestris IBT 28561]PKY00123.1 hypothetical protein P168DRAFT_285633 [Aspergillus campestris IBT 28561]